MQFSSVRAPADLANQGLLPMDMGELTEEHISKWL